MRLEDKIGDTLPPFVLAYQIMIATLVVMPLQAYSLIHAGHIWQSILVLPATAALIRGVVMAASRADRRETELMGSKRENNPREAAGMIGVFGIAIALFGLILWSLLPSTQAIVSYAFFAAVAVMYAIMWHRNQRERELAAVALTKSNALCAESGEAQ